ncbi:hypothetical protein Q5752_003312 [Cryptotrichosporon argae]
MSPPCLIYASALDMLHRRRPTDGLPPSGPPPSAPPPPAYLSTPPNTAYRPLRRPSSQLYPSAPGAARYAVPVSPYEHGGGYGFPSSSPGAAYTHGNGNGKGSGGGEGDWASVVHWLRNGIESARDGVRDAVRLDRSWSLVWTDLELRTLVLKSTLINLLSLFFLSLFPLLAPLLSASASPLAQTRTAAVGRAYNVLLSWPVFLVCFWVNASWGPDISRRAQALLHPAYRHQPATSASPSAAPFDPAALARASINRLLLIADFTLVARALRLAAAPVALAYMAVVNAYYSFEWTFVSRGWPLDVRARFVADRAAYMFGFGLPATLLSSFAPPLVNMAVFALIYPFLVIQALQARPPRSSLAGLLTPPSPGSPLPPSPSPYDDPPLAPSPSPLARGITGSGAGAALRGALGRARVPLFVGARHAMAAVDWLEAALLRDRSGGHRRRADRGKR